MDDRTAGCLICGTPLVHRTGHCEMECAICHGRFSANSECENGHYVCDRCHMSGAVTAASVCLASRSKDPAEILTMLMRMPGVHMHGPEHHVLVGSALLTAYRNAGGDLDLPSALEEMRVRGTQVPGGVCGLWGACGAAISCGIAYSIMTGSTPMSGGTWGRCNTLTARCLEAIGAVGGPRCCKRDGYTALAVASGYVGDTLGVRMDAAGRTVCRFHGSNPQCIGARCPFFPGP